MFIRNCLTPRSELTVVSPEETVASALAKLEEHLSLPCVREDDTFAGIVSKRTLFEGFCAYRTTAGGTDVFASFLQQPVAPCVDDSIRTLTLDDPFESTLDIIIRHPFVPIVAEGKLIGIVKRGDIQHALGIAFAIGQPADRLLIGAPEMEGALHRLFSITHRLDLNIVTAVTFDARRDALNRRILLKVSPTGALDRLVAELERAGFQVIQVARHEDTVA
jgi:CBS domain-containing protein